MTNVILASGRNGLLAVVFSSFTDVDGSFRGERKKLTMMKPSVPLCVLALVAVSILLSSTEAFAPRPAIVSSSSRTFQGTAKTNPLFGFLGPKERESLSRDDEPEEFFQT